jgi:excinuclease ABC subunit C
MPDLKERIAALPHEPGVYLFSNESSEIIYIGKATSLKNRVSSYFTGRKDGKTRVLVSHIRSVDFIVTDSPVAALILENSLIKQHLPQYNIELKDAKSYPLIKLTNENLPRVLKVREKRTRRDEYFGPYTSVADVDQLVDAMSSILGLRSCRLRFKKPYNYPVCLEYHIGRCSGPCAGHISEEDYLEDVQTARALLKGNTTPLTEKLKARMLEASEARQYERAARLRDQMTAVTSIKTQHHIEGETSGLTLDFVGFAFASRLTEICVIRVNDGRIVNKEAFSIKSQGEPDEMRSTFLSRYYLDHPQLPDRIYLDSLEGDLQLIHAALRVRRQQEIEFTTPHYKRHRKILILARENAEIVLEQKLVQNQKVHTLRELKKLLKLPGLPRHIEGFDIATLDGKYNTGALVVFKDGEASKPDYRQYNFTDQSAPDDYAMMLQFVVRRYQRIKNENGRFPDLILIDGGKGQVSSAKKALEILNLDLPVAGLAKKEELIFLPGKRDGIRLQPESPVLKLLQRIRDESHRFSNTRLSRRYLTRELRSGLQAIPGLGSAKQRELLKSFHSVIEISQRSPEELTQVTGIGADLAQRILEHFREQADR